MANLYFYSPSGGLMGCRNTTVTTSTPSLGFFMAENKKSILLYCDLIHTVKDLSDDEAGRLFKHLLMYVNDQNPEPIDRLTQLLFEPIKQTLKRDLKKWESEKEDRSKKGIIGNLKRWHKDIYDKLIKEELTLEEAVKIANDRTATARIAKVAVSDSVSVSVSVSDNVKDINKFNFKESLLMVGANIKLVEDWMTVRKTKKAANTETALKSFLNEVRKSGKDLNEILFICAERSWQGFKAEWLNNIQNQSTVKFKCQDQNADGFFYPHYTQAEFDEKKKSRPYLKKL